MYLAMKSKNIILVALSSIFLLGCRKEENSVVEKFNVQSLNLNNISTKNITYTDINQNDLVIEDGILKKVKKGVKLRGAIRIPSNVTKVAYKSLSGQFEITSIDFNNVTEIEASIFDFFFTYGVPRLSSIRMPKVVRIGDSSFRNAQYLEVVEFPETLTHLGVRAFSKCIRLKTVVFRGVTPPKGLGNVVQTLITRTINGKRVEIRLPSEEKETATDAFDLDNARKVQLYIPLSSRKLYEYSLNVSAFKAGGDFNPKDVSEYYK